MNINFFGIKVHISYVFVCLITLFTAVDRTGLFCPLILSILLHETAHIVTLSLFGCKIKRIRLTIGSIGVDYVSSPSKRETVISLLAGPATNLVLAFAFFMCGFMTWFGVNLVLGLMNLLPIIGLDGGSVVETVLEGLLTAGTIRILSVIISFVAVSALLILNWVYLSNNYSLIVFSLYLVFPIILKILLKEKRN